MIDAACRPSLYLVKNTASPIQAGQSSRNSLHGSSIVLEVRNGRLSQNEVNVSDPNDATALINGLVMALVHALRIQQNR
jgi:hypothetical protein